MQTIEPLLAGHSFFKGLPKEHLKLIVGCSSNAIFNPEQFLFREGEEANTFYVIRSGRVQVETFSPKNGPITIQTAGEGDVLGWSWLVPPYHWRFDAKAAEQVRAIAIDGKCLREKCENDHNLGYELMKRFALIIAERLEATRFQLLDVYGK
ncbi:MAG TPA: Crp/Fnr family transcriptional regulator [candidate division Zixibacteria bacterium]|nr:Crp/Fnr family transcriptional regulator [candidate division Zixibacteria bacterium]HBZ00726.1 Crp/Fnr family transcriptional regulator [candidate division Zixibacteria bacterium]